MIKKADVFKEIVSPSELENQEDPKVLLEIYKAQYMAIRLLLDIRKNQVVLSKGDKIETGQPKKRTKKVDNPVIKPTDNV